MLEPMIPEYSNSMYLKGFSPTQIYSAFKQTQRRKQKDKRKKKEEESILEKETFAFIEAKAPPAKRRESHGLWIQPLLYQ